MVILLKPGKLSFNTSFKKGRKYPFQFSFFLQAFSVAINRTCPLKNKLFNCLLCSSKTKTSPHSDHSIQKRGKKSFKLERKEREKKICCKAIKYNSSCCDVCEERVIAMTHWCNPFKTLWLRPRLPF